MPALEEPHRGGEAGARREPPALPGARTGRARRRLPRARRAEGPGGRRVPREEVPEPARRALRHRSGTRRVPGSAHDQGGRRAARGRRGYHRHRVAAGPPRDRWPRRRAVPHQRSPLERRGRGAEGAAALVAHRRRRLHRAGARSDVPPLRKRGDPGRAKRGDPRARIRAGGRDDPGRRARGGGGPDPHERSRPLGVRGRARSRRHG